MSRSKNESKAALRAKEIVGQYPVLTKGTIKSMKIMELGKELFELALSDEAAAKIYLESDTPYFLRVTNLMPVANLEEFARKRGHMVEALIARANIDFMTAGAMRQAIPKNTESQLAQESPQSQPQPKFETQPQPRAQQSPDPVPLTTLQGTQPTPKEPDVKPDVPQQNSIQQKSPDPALKTVEPPKPKSNPTFEFKSKFADIVAVKSENAMSQDKINRIKKDIEAMTFQVGDYFFIKGGKDLTLDNGQEKRVPQRVFEIYELIKNNKDYLKNPEKADKLLQAIHEKASNAIRNPGNGQHQTTADFYAKVEDISKTEEKSTFTLNR